MINMNQHPPPHTHTHVSKTKGLGRVGTAGWNFAIALVSPIMGMTPLLHGDLSVLFPTGLLSALIYFFSFIIV